MSGDLTNAASLVPAVRDVDAVVHLAAVTHSRNWRRYDAVNHVGTRWLLEAACRESAKMFVFASTRAISPEGGSYSRSKALAEEAVKNSGLAFTILRFAEIYGSNGAEGLDRIVRLAMRGRLIPVVGAGDDEVCPLFVDDASASLGGALRVGPRGQTYTLGGQPVSVREFAETAVRVFNSRSHVVGIPFQLVKGLCWASRIAPLPLYPDQLSRLSTAKSRGSWEAAADLDFSPRSLVDGLAALGRE